MKLINFYCLGTPHNKLKESGYAIKMLKTTSSRFCDCAIKVYICTVIEPEYCDINEYCTSIEDSFETK